jgi:uncharacterized protein DUF4230
VVGSALIVGCIVAAAFAVGRLTVSNDATGAGARGTPGVILAIHDVARLETTVFHIEKVVEVGDAQSRLWGLVQAKDAVILVAVGDVAAGVDLTKVRAEDVHTDPVARAVRVVLPTPEIVSATLDARATHVYSRSTDLLAHRNEQLEGDARRTAEEQMRKAAIDEGILERARTSAERTLGALLRELGYQNVEIDWTERS